MVWQLTLALLKKLTGYNLLMVLLLACCAIAASIRVVSSQLSSSAASAIVPVAATIIDHEHPPQHFNLSFFENKIEEDDDVNAFRKHHGRSALIVSFINFNKWRTACCASPACFFKTLSLNTYITLRVLRL